MDGSDRLLIGVKNIFRSTPSILTSPAHNNPFCVEEKKEWMAKYFDGLYDEFLCTDDKHLCANINSLLIDDREDFIERFKSYDGWVIQHSDVDKTLRGCEVLLIMSQGIDAISRNNFKKTT
jgi:5'(3')-deoxyribonucleotidase